jgi:hypothetical protein
MMKGTLIARESLTITFLFFSFADPLVQQRHAIQKLALHEYYEKHGGAPGHH